MGSLRDQVTTRGYESSNYTVTNQVTTRSDSEQHAGLNGLITARPPPGQAEKAQLTRYAIGGTAQLAHLYFPAFICITGSGPRDLRVSARQLPEATFRLSGCLAMQSFGGAVQQFSARDSELTCVQSGQRIHEPGFLPCN